MQHSTRKRPRRLASDAIALGLASGALALGLATSLTLPTDAATALEGEAEPAAGAIAGGGGAAGGDDPDAIVVTEPFAQIIRIVPEYGMAALLYLPALPVLDEDGRLPGPLEKVVVERADASAPDAWELVGTLVWNEDWQEYASPDADLSLMPVYADDQRTDVRYCIVHYGSDVADYRDFYLRATAVACAGGKRSTIVHAPALVAYPENEKPDADGPDAEGPDVVAPPDVPAGDSGGNRGGVGQGESVRRGGSSDAGAPSSERARTVAPHAEGEAPAGGASSSGNATGEEAAGKKNGDGGARPESSAGEGSDGNGRTVAPASSGQPSSEPASQDGERDVPGFAWAVGGTAAAVAVTGAAAALFRARKARRRPAPR